MLINISHINSISIHKSARHDFSVDAVINLSSNIIFTYEADP